MHIRIVRRKYRILLLIAVTGSIYLSFQLLSIKVLNFSSKHDLKHKSKLSAMILDDIPLESNVAVPNEVSEKKSYKDGKDKKVANQGHIDRNVTLLRGTHVTEFEEYRPNSDEMFRCLQSKKLIPFTSVNDDYCDCDDSTDEPGTSACPASRFYCTFQNLDIQPQYILGSRVNDGVCDCCDGSDEWGRISVFSGVHLTDKRWKDSLSHAPCKDDCKALLKINEDDTKIRELGRRLKQTYLEKGRTASNKELYGPNAVFYKLSMECFDYHVNEYKYTLCPFKSVTQQAFPRSSISIGQTPVWKVRLPGHFVLKMDKGAAYRCPLYNPRNTVINFICGLTDKIVHVSEDEKCSYSMRFSTPAAC